MKVTQRRDLTIISSISKESGDCLIIACDSCGGVGLKANDALKLSPRYTAKFTARVALTEIMCSGAVPIAVINGVSNEMNPTGKETIRGIRDELANAGFSESTDIPVNGSTEENFATSMTALSITVIGSADANKLKFKSAVQGDRLILIGNPAVGSEVDLESKGFYTEIRQLLSLPEVREIVPVGSKGILYEAQTLAALNGMNFKPRETGRDYCKSAGPATCLLVLCDSSFDYPKGTIVGELACEK